MLSNKPDILNCISSRYRSLKWSCAGQNDQGRKALCLLQDGTKPRVLYFSATIFFSALKPRAPAVHLPDPRAVQHLVQMKWTDRMGKAESVGRKPCKWGREGCLGGRRQGGEQRRV